MIDRYTTDAMDRVWSNERKLCLWYVSERAALRGWNEFDDDVSQSSLQALQGIGMDLSWSRVKDIEQRTKHETAAFVQHLEEQVLSEPEYGEDEARWIHYGLTSSDILDTSLSLQMRQAWKHIETRVRTLLDTCDRLKSRMSTKGIGRSHGIHAEPIDYGTKADRWRSMLNRSLERMSNTMDRSLRGMFSGPVGNHETVPEEVEQCACDFLNLLPCRDSSQIIPRDHHASIVSRLGLLGSCVEKIATDIRLMSQTELNEVEESFGDDQKGSSSMPHKRNPILSENLCGQARMLRSFIVPAMENVALWHERDMSHSSVERQIIPDAFVLTDFVIKRLNHVLDNIVIHDESIIENRHQLGDLTMSHRLMLRLIREGMSREEAYQTTKSCAQTSIESDRSMFDIFREEWEGEDADDILDDLT